MKKTVFLDRDGVINELVDRGKKNLVHGKLIQFTAPWSAEEFKIKAGVREALEMLGRASFLRIVVTNQPDLAYGLMRPEEFEQIMNATRGLSVEDVYACPHGRDEGCECRKPKPGMLLDAGRKWSIDFSNSYMIGDMETDILAGKAAGCRTIYITDTGKNEYGADYIASNLLEAANCIAN